MGLFGGFIQSLNFMCIYLVFWGAGERAGVTVFCLWNKKNFFRILKLNLISCNPPCLIHMTEARYSGLRYFWSTRSWRTRRSWRSLPRSLRSRYSAACSKVSMLISAMVLLVSVVWYTLSFLSTTGDWCRLLPGQWSVAAAAHSWGSYIIQRETRYSARAL